MATEKLSDKKEKLVKQVNTAVSAVSCGEVVALGRFPGVGYPLAWVVRAFRTCVEGQEEKSLQPLRSTTSAAEARNCMGGLNARTTQDTTTLELL
jgi:hypothetical protein